MNKRLLQNFPAIIAALLCGVSLAPTAQAWSHGYAAVTHASKRASAKASKAFTAVVTHVTDGDTMWVQSDRGGAAIDVRIQGIDAPEICQDYGKAAQSALASRVLHHTVSVSSKARDRYGRMIAKVSDQGQDLGAWLVSSGHAWSNHYRQSLGAYGAQETAARQARMGLWASGSPVEPKMFRKRMKCHK